MHRATATGKAAAAITSRLIGSMPRSNDATKRSIDRPTDRPAGSSRACESRNVDPNTSGCPGRDANQRSSREYFGDAPLHWTRCEYCKSRYYWNSYTMTRVATCHDLREPCTNESFHFRVTKWDNECEYANAEKNAGRTDIFRERIG